MFIYRTQRILVLAGFAAAVMFAAADSGNSSEAVRVAVDSGTATFVATTNIPAISVKGKSSALKGCARVRRAGDGYELEQIEAEIPVKSLATGMRVRDEHMRKYVFTTANGAIPDVTFEAAAAKCSKGSCQVAGKLSIRGVARPFTLSLKIREEGAGFRATGQATVRLSDYGIEAPSQFSVKTTDEVQLQIEFTAKPRGTQLMASGGKR